MNLFAWLLALSTYWHPHPPPNDGWPTLPPPHICSIKRPC